MDCHQADAAEQAARSSGTLPTGGALFVWFLLAVIVIAGGRTYLPAMALGPIVEHLRIAIGALN
jgi:K+-transporting ATPase ATPase A chain